MIFAKTAICLIRCLYGVRLANKVWTFLYVCGKWFRSLYYKTFIQYYIELDLICQVSLRYIEITIYELDMSMW